MIENVLKKDIKSGVPIPVALGKAIKKYGTKEFCKKSKMHSTQVYQLMKKGSNPTLGTLTKMLKIFGLKVGVL